MIGIIGAMKDEVAILLDHLEESYDSPERHGLYEFHSGKLSGVDVVICNCYPGKVNAATVTTIMIQQYDVDLILNIGIARSIDSEHFDIGDIVMCDIAKQYDVDTSAIGDSKEFISGCCKSVFHTDYNLLTTISDHHAINIASVATGDTFIDSEEIKLQIDARIIDMESGAIAQVCHSLGYIPFLIIKCISDNGDSKQYEENKEKCCKTLQNFVLDVIQEIHLRN